MSRLCTRLTYSSSKTDITPENMLQYFKNCQAWKNPNLIQIWIRDVVKQQIPLIVKRELIRNEKCFGTCGIVMMLRLCISLTVLLTGICSMIFTQIE